MILPFLTYAQMHIFLTLWAKTCMTIQLRFCLNNLALVFKK